MGRSLRTSTTTEDGLGGYTSVTKDQNGKVVSKRLLDRTAKAAPRCDHRRQERERDNGSEKRQRHRHHEVKDKHGKVVSTTTHTPDGQGGYTSVTKDKMETS